MISSEVHRDPNVIPELRQAGLMRDMQTVILAVFAIPIAIMCWILWRVTDELGDFEFFRRKPYDRESSIRVRAGSMVHFSNVRSSRYSGLQ